MLLLKHDKKFGDNLEIQETVVELSLDCKNNQLDNIIYYLICAQEKMNAWETWAFESRAEMALQC